MKAIQISHSQELNIIEMEKPAEVKAGEVLLKLDFVGFCGSDLNTFLGRNTMALNPVVPGHEIGATIEAVGAEVPESLNACQHNETLGVQRNGAMKEYIVMPWEKIIPAGKLSAKTRALIEPMSVGFHAVSRAQVTDVDTVMVIGCGMVGMGAIVRAVTRGATVIAADLDDEKLELAKQMGATYAVNTKTENVHERLAEITGGFGPDVIVEAVGNPFTYQMAVNEVAFTGRVACIGYAKQDVTFTTKLFVQKELDIRGSRNATPEDFRAVIKYLERGTAPVDKLITKVIKPEEALETMQWWSENPGKVFRILVEF